MKHLCLKEWKRNAGRNFRLIESKSGLLNLTGWFNLTNNLTLVWTFFHIQPGVLLNGKSCKQFCEPKTAFLIFTELVWFSFSSFTQRDWRSAGVLSEAQRWGEEAPWNKNLLQRENRYLTPLCPGGGLPRRRREEMAGSTGRRRRRRAGLQPATADTDNNTEFM